MLPWQQPWLLWIVSSKSQMMPYIIMLKAGKFHQQTGELFSTARKKPVGGTIPPQKFPPPRKPEYG